MEETAPAPPEEPPAAELSRRRRALVRAGVVVAVVGLLLVLMLIQRRTAADLDRLIVRAAQRHRLAPALVRAVVQAESSGNPRAVSRAQAYGLMQLRIPTASEMAGRPVTIEELYDARTNLDLGCRYLRRMLQNYDGDLRLSLMAYNAGPGNVEKWLRKTRDVDQLLEKVAFAQTRAYVKKVLRLANEGRG